ncbi:MAG: 2'-deoxycytidine 5'-triphosphate deaminase [Proteobacteria bacterium]|nr:2'-deoxycytidine 5'-triphosphate deaminase [Pseudomonadota bacterium]
MAKQVESLFLNLGPDLGPKLEPTPEDDSALSPHHTTGILPSQALRGLVGEGVIASAEALAPGQIQPASLDLRLGDVAYRVRASYLPGSSHTVRQKIEAIGMHEVDLSGGAVLERGAVFIVPLQEELRLKKGLSGVANPKSSTGRLDIFTRLITDYATQFDRVTAQYKGPLYVEISPRTFTIVVREGSRLIQLRLRRGHPPATAAGTRRLHERVSLIQDEDGGDTLDERISSDVPVSVDLRGDPETGIVGYKARAHTGLIDVDAVGAYDAADFWEPIPANESRTLTLDPNAFYILASKEAVTVPPDHAAEMAPFNPLHGEFRVHYAGFFDPGFGHSESGGAGSRAVLEVRSYEVPFLLEDGQTVGRLVYERLTETPDVVYGAQLGSSYQRQGLKLSKHFRQ